MVFESIMNGLNQETHHLLAGDLMNTFISIFASRILSEHGIEILLKLWQIEFD
jgi:hypothetical protein